MTSPPASTPPQPVLLIPVGTRMVRISRARMASVLALVAEPGETLGNFLIRAAQSVST
jgi:hypothetical protein